MKVISNGNVFDFDKVTKLNYRASVVGDGYPIEIKYLSNGLFNDSTELTRVPTAHLAYQLVCVLTENWALNTPVFDVDKWLSENSSVCTEEGQSQNLTEQISILVSEARNLEKAVTDLLEGS